jgi:hypothetical protein
MAQDTPLSRLVLTASSVAEDLGFVALADIAKAVGDGGPGCRVIGGHMVTVLAARWMLGADLYRETRDVDIGVTPILARDVDICRRLKELGYDQVAGNRFIRTMADVPVTLAGTATGTHQATIDVLVPAYTSRARSNVKITDELISTEVLGLAAALARPAVAMTLELHRLNGEMRRVGVPFPDEASALVLKAWATRVRARATDVTDVWRCLEIAYAASVQPSDFERSGRNEAAAIVRDLFSQRDGFGMTCVEHELRLARHAKDQRYTRLQALISRVLGTT